MVNRQMLYRGQGFQEMGSLFPLLSFLVLLSSLQWGTHRGIFGWFVPTGQVFIRPFERIQKKEKTPTNSYFLPSEPSSGDGNKDLGYGSSSAVYALGPVPSTGYEDGKE
ncbi:hypothetical protein CsSME_00021502 [Camellia sinensis var. sinensis]